MILKKVLIFLIILIFSLSTAYNLYSWKYQESIEIVKSGLNIEFEELKQLIQEDGNKQELLDKVEYIETYMKFQQTTCFENE